MLKNQEGRKPKVLICYQCMPVATELLSPHCDIIQWKKTHITRNELLENVEGVDGIICTPLEKIDLELLQRAGKNLKVISTYSAGIDHINTEECLNRGIKIGHAPGSMNTAVAEFVVSLVLATARCYKKGLAYLTLSDWGTWNHRTQFCRGRQLKDSVLGIYGLGRIGLSAAKLLKGFGPSEILYHNRTPNEKAEEVDATYVTFDTLLEKSDFLIASCSLNSENMGIFNAKAFSKMKKTVVFVNVSRGGLVNHDDLATALQNLDIWAAGLDVTSPEPLPKEHPLMALENCVITPHVAFTTDESEYAISELSARNIFAGLTGDNLPSPCTTDCNEKRMSNTPSSHNKGERWNRNNAAC